MVSGEKVSRADRDLERHFVLARAGAGIGNETPMVCALSDGAFGCLSGAERTSSKFHVLFSEKLYGRIPTVRTGKLFWNTYGKCRIL